MFKKAGLFFILLLTALMMAGCGAKGTLEILPNDDNTISITASRAGASGGGGADITLSDGQKLVVDSSLSKGEIQIRFFRESGPADPNASVEEILHTNDSPSLDITVNTPGSSAYAVEPGSYTIMVNIPKSATGTITIRTE